ncbi:hypothetical protein SAMN05216392_0760 [Streptococcus equinus]|uniref:Uncharacterized protein n=1 Tax=Streptococcus equinus TaxID=1335 RepID=A0A1H0YMV4_STREI|nr:hypothetical protein [Streptococcus equinus]QBX15758.1 hypothetical protein Javan213_0010 [Streptococcus phage Javan213]SDQ16499.1 hypothetical protein SAMN05216392_0760 [Streptococcus equinus]
MIKADVVIAEQRQIIDVPVMTKSEAIRVIFKTYGISTEIKRWIEDEEQEEVKDEQVNSEESNDVDDAKRASGNQKGDVLQANE